MKQEIAPQGKQTVLPKLLIIVFSTLKKKCSFASNVFNLKQWILNH